MTLELATIFLFTLVLMSNLAVIKFAEGYFGYFDISLGSINFTPRMYDYASIVMPVLVASVIVTLIVAVSMKVSFSVGDFFANKKKPNKSFSQYAKRHEKVIMGLMKVLDFIFFAFVAGVIVWVFYSFTTDLSKNYGEATAKNMTRLSSISMSGDNFQDIIIYKGNGEIITKKYDVSQKEFLDGYRVVATDNYQVRYINRK